MKKGNDWTGNQPWEELKAFLKQQRDATKGLVKLAVNGTETKRLVEHEVGIYEAILKQMRVIERD